MIPGFLISLLTFPGVVLHEFAHKKFCDLFNVKVLKVNYLTLSGDGYVIHEKPKDFKSTFWISVGPLILNSVSCFVLGLITASQILHAGALYYLAGWLAISFGAHSFPSNHDVEHILKESKNRIQNNESFLHYLSYPFVGLIKIANLLRFFWIDFLWAFLLIGFAFNIFNQNVFAQDSTQKNKAERPSDTLVVGDYYCSRFHASESEKIDPINKEEVKMLENELMADNLYLETLASEIKNMHVDEYSQESIDRYKLKVNYYDQKFEEYNDAYSLYSFKRALYNEMAEKYNNYLKENCEMRSN